MPMSLSRIWLSCLIGLAAVPVLIGCGASDDVPTDQAGGKALAGQSAIYVDYGGPVNRRIREQFIEPVAVETGLNIKFDAPTDYAKLETQVRSGNVSWTVVQGEPFWAIEHCDDLLEPVPASVDLSHIDSRFLTDDCSVPGEVYSYNVVYDEDTFENEPPSSWEDFFDVEKYPGKRATWGPYVGNGILEGALVADGVAIDDLYPLDLDRAFAKLDTIKDDLFLYDTLAQAQQLIESKEVTMLVVYPPTAWLVNKLPGANWSPIWDGALLTFDPYFIPKGGNVEAGAAMLQSIVSPEAQRNLAEIQPVGWSVKDLDADIPADIAKWSPTAEGHDKNAIVMDQQWWADNYAAVNQRWTEWVSG